MDFKDFKAKNISTIPLQTVDETGMPTKEPVKGMSWLPYQTKIADNETIEQWMSANYSVGIISGEVSGNLQVVDIDEKYNLNKEPLHITLNNIIKQQDDTILPRCLVQQTMSGGLHLIYRTEEPVNDKGKFASRDTTASERAAKPKEKVKTLIESTKMIKYYGLVAGSWDNIPVLTIDEHKVIVNAAKSMDERVKEPRVNTPRPARPGEVRPLDDYDAHHDWTDSLALLEQHGWTEVFRVGRTIHLRRPGKDRGTSATLNHYPDQFIPFTSSCEFEPGTGYKPHQVWAILEYNGDFTAAAKAAAADGYGEKPEEHYAELVHDSVVNGSVKTHIYNDEETAKIMSRVQTIDSMEDQFVKYQRKGEVFTLSDQFGHLRDTFAEIELGHVAAIGAFSSVGKTSFITQVINDGTRGEGENNVSLFFSLEMSARDMYLRYGMVESEAGEDGWVDVKDTKKKIMTDAEFRRRIKFKWSNIHMITDAYNIDEIYEIYAVVKAQYALQGISVNNIIIDFYQFLDKAHSIEHQPVIAAKMKQYSKKHDCRTFILAQLNQNFPKEQEPDETAISGSQAFFNKCDKVFLGWADKQSICLKDTKPRWGKPGKWRLESRGMMLFTSLYTPPVSKNQPLKKV